MAHLVIVDGMGFVFRAYHAVRGNLTRADGLPTNALFGVAQMLIKVVDDLQPDLCVVALDSKGKNWRHDLYPNYKANRPAPDEALVRQLEFVEPLIRAFGLPVLRQSGVEADDVIATLIEQHKADKVTIVTSDKDLLQLVGTRNGGEVVLLDTLKDKISGPAESVEKFGVLPALVADVQGLMGDSSDNIPGVPGVGPKTAAELVQRFGTLEQIYADLDKLEKAPLREKLLANREAAFLSRDLARLRYDVALPEIDMSFKPRLHEAADYLRDELEFKTLAARLDKRKTASAEGMMTTRSFFKAPAGEGPAAPAPVAGGAEGWGPYETVTTLERWQWWMDEAKKRGRVAFDTETTSLDPYEARLVGVSLALGKGLACYVPVKEQRDKGTEGQRVEQGDLFVGGDAAPVGPHGVEGLDVLKDLRVLLADAGVVKIGHNMKYDWLVLARALGVTPAETGPALQELVVNYEDTMLMSGCLDGGRWGHGMDELVSRHLGHTMIAYKELCGTGKAEITFDKVELAKACAYAAEDADATWRLWEVLSGRLEAEGVVGGAESELHPVPSPGSVPSPAPAAARNGNYSHAFGESSAFKGGVVPHVGVKFIYECVERPLLPVIVALEARGVRVDEDELRRLSADFAARMAEYEKQIWGVAGKEFNVQSTQQLAVVLFDELGLGSDKMKKNRSTAVGVLEELAEDGHLIATQMVAYRQLAKLRSTYAEALIAQVSSLTGRVHTHYQQIGAATGRFSSTDPNLQNIPIRTEEGRKIRKAFVAKPGWVMVSADYSQIELRLLAHFSGSEALRTAFREGVDIHAYTAALVRGIPVAEVSKEQRRAAKFINFGLVYGMGARSLAGQIGCSVSEAQAWIEAYFKRYEGVREYMELNKRLAREKGYVETLCGRRVWLPDINNSNGGLRAGAERAAINAPLQGSNADVIKLAMPQVEKALQGHKAQLLMQVHDELVLECAPEAVDAVKRILPEVMGGVVDLAVPLAVEVGVGPNWEEAH